MYKRLRNRGTSNQPSDKKTSKPVCKLCGEVKQACLCILKNDLAAAGRSKEDDSGGRTLRKRTSSLRGNDTSHIQANIERIGNDDLLSKADINVDHKSPRARVGASRKKRKVGESNAELTEDAVSKDSSSTDPEHLLCRKSTRLSAISGDFKVDRLMNKLSSKTNPVVCFAEINRSKNKGSGKCKPSADEVSYVCESAIVDSSIHFANQKTLHNSCEPPVNYGRESESEISTRNLMRYNSVSIDDEQPFVDRNFEGTNLNAIPVSTSSGEIHDVQIERIVNSSNPDELVEPAISEIELKRIERCKRADAKETESTLTSRSTQTESNLSFSVLHLEELETYSKSNIEQSTQTYTEIYSCSKALQVCADMVSRGTQMYPEPSKKKESESANSVLVNDTEELTKLMQLFVKQLKTANPFEYLRSLTESSNKGEPERITDEVTVQKKILKSRNCLQQCSFPIITCPVDQPVSLLREKNDAGCIYESTIQSTTDKSEIPSKTVDPKSCNVTTEGSRRNSHSNVLQYSLDTNLVSPEDAFHSKTYEHVISTSDSGTTDDTNKTQSINEQLGNGSSKEEATMHISEAQKKFPLRIESSEVSAEYLSSSQHYTDQYIDSEKIARESESRSSTRSEKAEKLEEKGILNAEDSLEPQSISISAHFNVSSLKDGGSVVHYDRKRSGLDAGKVSSDLKSSLVSADICAKDKISSFIEKGEVNTTEDGNFSESVHFLPETNETSIKVEEDDQYIKYHDDDVISILEEGDIDQLLDSMNGRKSWSAELERKINLQNSDEVTLRQPVVTDSSPACNTVPNEIILHNLDSIKKEEAAERSVTNVITEKSSSEANFDLIDSNTHDYDDSDKKFEEKTIKGTGSTDDVDLPKPVQMGSDFNDVTNERNTLDLETEPLKDKEGKTGTEVTVSSVNAMAKKVAKPNKNLIEETKSLNAQSRTDISKVSNADNAAKESNRQEHFKGNVEQNEIVKEDNKNENPCPEDAHDGNRGPIRKAIEASRSTYPIKGLDVEMEGEWEYNVPNIFKGMCFRGLTRECSCNRFQHKFQIPFLQAARRLSTKDLYNILMFSVYKKMESFLREFALEVIKILASRKEMNVLLRCAVEYKKKIVGSSEFWQLVLQLVVNSESFNEKFLFDILKHVLTNVSEEKHESYEKLYNLVVFLACKFQNIDLLCEVLHHLVKEKYCFQESTIKALLSRCLDIDSDKNRNEIFKRTGQILLSTKYSVSFGSPTLNLFNKLIESLHKSDQNSLATELRNKLNLLNMDHIPKQVSNDQGDLKKEKNETHGVKTEVVGVQEKAQTPSKRPAACNSDSYPPIKKALLSDGRSNSTELRYKSETSSSDAKSSSIQSTVESSEQTVSCSTAKKPLLYDGKSHSTEKRHNTGISSSDLKSTNIQSKAGSSEKTVSCSTIKKPLLYGGSSYSTEKRHITGISSSDLKSTNIQSKVGFSKQMVSCLPVKKTLLSEGWPNNTELRYKSGSSLSEVKSPSVQSTVGSSEQTISCLPFKKPTNRRPPLLQTPPHFITIHGPPDSNFARIDSSIPHSSSSFYQQQIIPNLQQSDGRKTFHSSSLVNTEKYQAERFMSPNARFSRSGASDLNDPLSVCKKEERGSEFPKNKLCNSSSTVTSSTINNDLSDIPSEIQRTGQRWRKSAPFTPPPLMNIDTEKPRGYQSNLGKTDTLEALNYQRLPAVPPISTSPRAVSDFYNKSCNPPQENDVINLLYLRNWTAATFMSTFQRLVLTTANEKELNLMLIRTLEQDLPEAPAILAPLLKCMASRELTTSVHFLKLKKVFETVVFNLILKMVMYDAWEDAHQLMTMATSAKLCLLFSEAYIEEEMSDSRKLLVMSEICFRVGKMDEAIDRMRFGNLFATSSADWKYDSLEEDQEIQITLILNLISVLASEGFHETCPKIFLSVYNNQKSLTMPIDLRLHANKVVVCALNGNCIQAAYDVYLASVKNVFLPKSTHRAVLIGLVLNSNLSLAHEMFRNIHHLNIYPIYRGYSSHDMLIYSYWEKEEIFMILDYAFNAMCDTRLKTMKKRQMKAFCKFSIRIKVCNPPQDFTVDWPTSREGTNETSDPVPNSVALTSNTLDDARSRIDSVLRNMLKPAIRYDCRVVTEGLEEVCILQPSSLVAHFIKRLSSGKGYCE